MCVNELSNASAVHVSKEFISVEDRAKLGLPATEKDYDTDAEALAQVLREHFVNAYVKAFTYADLDGYFGGLYPWFFRTKIIVLGKEIIQDIGFHEWYGMKDKHLIVHMTRRRIIEDLTNYIEGKGLRYTK
jgi:hypothetical protein